MNLEEALRGRVIAIPESRELDVFAGLLTRRGADVIRCPLVSILDAPDPAPVLAWLRAFNAGECSDLILMTGEGLRRLLSCIEQHDPSLRASFIENLARVRKFARGPKPVKALRELGLSADITVSPATTAGVIAALSAVGDLQGRIIGVQHYGTEPNLPLTGFLHDSGAQVRSVAPYVYASDTDDRDVLTLIERLTKNTVDAIAFTSQSQVERLFKLAASAQLETALIKGLQGTFVAAVGPITAASLAQHGICVDAVPQDSYFLKPLTQILVRRLGR